MITTESIFCIVMFIVFTIFFIGCAVCCFKEADPGVGIYMLLCIIIIALVFLPKVKKDFDTSKYFENNYTYEKIVALEPYSNETIYNDTEYEYKVVPVTKIYDTLYFDTISPNYSYIIENPTGKEKIVKIYKANKKSIENKCN